MSRRIKLKEMLANEPDDPFLNYALALEEVKEGDRVEGVDRLVKMIEKSPDFVAAYFRLGQFHAEEGNDAAARGVLESGLQAADRVGDAHAASEMLELLRSLSH